MCVKIKIKILMQLYYPFIDAAINNVFTRLCECACLNKKDVHDGDCASLLSACPTGATQAFALPDDIEVDIKNLLSVRVSHVVPLWSCAVTLTSTVEFSRV